MCSAGVADGFAWQVSRGLYNSDHFPVWLKRTGIGQSVSIKKFNFERADWVQFKTKAITGEEVGRFETGDLAMGYLEKVITAAAEACVPMSSGSMVKKRAPWWNSEINRA